MPFPPAVCFPEICALVPWLRLPEYCLLEMMACLPVVCFPSLVLHLPAVCLSEIGFLPEILPVFWQLLLSIPLSMLRSWLKRQR